jgi:hypothetical protein
MDTANFEHARRIRAADEWANRDPFDPYRRLLLDAVLDLETDEAWVAMADEIERNP